MPIAPYYQGIIDQVYNFSKRRHRASFIGMFNCANDFLFRHIASHGQAPASPQIIPVDLNKTDDDQYKILSAFYQSLVMMSPGLKPFKSYDDVWQAILAATKQNSITFILYFGDEGNVSLQLIEAIYRWRNHLGNLLNWIVFANYKILHGPHSSDILFEKFIKANIIPVLPIDRANSLFVYRSFREYLGVLKPNLSKDLINLSGGNPGLLKSLYILAQHEHINKWRSDQKIIMRIKGILDDLSKKELEALFSVTNGDRTEKNTVDGLQRFGYINKYKKIFSPLVQDYLSYYYEPSFNQLSLTQQRVFNLLKDKSELPLSRDEIARVVWGKRWHEKYSDWAIDQMIYAIRTVLKNNKSNWLIKTKRNAGYYLTSKKHG